MTDWTPPALSDEHRKAIRGHIIVASVSGGKDSAAMCLWLAENEIDHVRVFADTGWEHPATYEYLRGPLTAKLGPIAEVRSLVGGMADVVRRKAMFPSRQRRFCMQELKVFPLMAYVSEVALTAGVPAVNAVGIRSAESRSRALLTDWEWQSSFGCPVWRPLLRWTEADVIAMHARHGLPPNPLYLWGASRVGCWPCIFARKGEIARVADMTPERIDEIEALEAEVELMARARYAAKGETFESLGYAPPAFFQAQGALRSDGVDGRGVQIREVVTWARTARGGR